MPEELPLEPDLIKVLAADTRRQILSLLQDRRMTVTELSRELDLGKATVHEHLNKLTDVGLVEREEDDRLWVYYRLTGRGKRLLNPQRTRFYLALASAVVAALVAGLAVYGFMMTGGVGTVDEAGTFQSAVVPTEEEVYADDAIEIPARMQGSGDVDAYLVDEDSAERIQQGDLDVQGLRMQATSPYEAQDGETEARGNATLLRSDASLPPGTYHLYVRDAHGDNAPSMPSIRLVGLEASLEQDAWYQQLDEGPLTIEVTRDGEPAEGLLRLTGGPQVGTSPTTSIEQGQARVPTDTLDELAPGPYRVSVQPNDTERWIDLPSQLTLTPPALAAFPLHVQEDGTPPVRLHVDDVPRLQALDPTVNGSPARIEAIETGWVVELDPQDPGSTTIELARSSTSVDVHPTVNLEAQVHDGPEVRWNVSGPHDQPLADAALYIDGASQGFTDADGRLVTDLPEQGEHRLAVHRADGYTITRTITVDGWELSSPPPALTVEPVDVASRDGHADVTVQVTNPSPLAHPVTLVADVTGQPAASHSLTVPANGTTEATLAVPVDAGRQEVGVDAQPHPTGRFTATNETTQPEGGGAGGDDADGPTATDDAATTETVDGTGTASRATVELPGPETADGAVDGDASRLEPVHPAAEGEAAEEAPGAGLVASLLALATATILAARARKP